MKKLIPILVVSLLAAFAVPALAGDGYLEWTADKTITLTETFTYSETVAFVGSGIFVFNGEAWAKVQEQQEIYNNGLSTTIQEINPATNRQAAIVGSFGSATGVANVNQAPGNLNNQANEVAISVASAGLQTSPPVPGQGEAVFVGMFAEAQAVSVQYIGIVATATKDDTFATFSRTDAPNYLATTGTKGTSIDGSFAGFFGVANVNQAAGSMNNQGNGVAIAAGIDQKIVKAVTHVMLAQASANNRLTDNGSVTSDAISNGAFNGAHGVFNVNQASGAMNNQKNIVTLGFSHPGQ